MGQRIKPSEGVTFDIGQIGGVSPAYDSTDKQRVSIYGKQASAGDTPILVDAQGRPLVDIRRIGGQDVVLAVDDNLTIANIPAFVPGMSNNAAGAERLHSVSGLGDGQTFALLANGAFLWNLAGWDRQRGNLDNYTILASAARTTTQTPADITNYNHRGVVICVDTTVVPGSAPSNVVTINGKDPVSGKYQTLLTGAAIVAVGTVFYTIYPGVTVAANVAVSVPLPRTFQVKITAGNANSATYSVGAAFIL